MELHSLKPVKGAVKKRKRIARGEGSGRGGTSTRGHKGAKSRSGYKRKRAFEGGQMPLQMRLPKRGFKNPNRTEYNVFNLYELQAISEKYGVTAIDIDFLKEKGYAQQFDKVKVLSNGEVTTALEVSVHAFSKTAKEAIEAQGGSAKIYE